MLLRAIKSLTVGRRQAGDHGSERVDAFFHDLSEKADKVDALTYAVVVREEIVGYSQLHRRGGEVTIHRLWTVSRARGNGSKLLRTLCDLADRNGVVLRLKVIPFGEKPFPRSAEQLRAWYHRYDFRGDKQLIRLPMSAAGSRG